MADPAIDLPHFTAEQYQELLRESAIKLEFVDGVVYAMSGASNWHNMAVINLIGALNARLPDHCRALGMDVQLAVKTATAEKYYFPDAFVSCGAFSVSHRHDAATIVAEVLSPTTETYDRNAKMLGYRALDALEEYLLIDPNAPTIEIYRRAEGWRKVIVRGAVDLVLPSASLSIPLTEIYRRIPVDFTSKP